MRLELGLVKPRAKVEYEVDKSISGEGSASLMILICDNLRQDEQNQILESLIIQISYEKHMRNLKLTNQRNMESGMTQIPSSPTINIATLKPICMTCSTYHHQDQP